jgi:hypothetical protein
MESNTGWSLLGGSLGRSMVLDNFPKWVVYKEKIVAITTGPRSNT